MRHSPSWVIPTKWASTGMTGGGGASPPLDSIGSWWLQTWASPTASLSDGLVQEMVASGSLRLIRDDTLRVMLLCSYINRLRQRATVRSIQKRRCVYLYQILYLDDKGYVLNAFPVIR